jgi:predicted phosphodiesterase
MSLDQIIGAAGVGEITAAGVIRFHAVGDTGRTNAGNEQEEVATRMQSDFHPQGGAANPAFFLHLGDVIYGHNKDLEYRDQFYQPYKNYPGKIVAIAGNHDGETYPGTDKIPAGAFLKNFCTAKAAVPPIASGVGIFRQTMTEPGVYWLLDMPFVQIVGLYSNVADGPGFLVGKNNDAQQTTWLAKTLTIIATQRKSGKRKALLVAVHHPPYSNGGHAGSPEVLAALDQACHAAGIMPDVLLSGHAHNYQRHTRRIAFNGKAIQIPFIVAGCGGHNDLPVAAAHGQVIGDRTYDKALRGYGFLDVTASSTSVKIEMWQAPSTGKTPFD